MTNDNFMKACEIRGLLDSLEELTLTNLLKTHMRFIRITNPRIEAVLNELMDRLDNAFIATRQQICFELKEEFKKL